MMNYEELITRFVEMSKRVLGNNLVGIYLHGSAAMGCFNPKKSDLDFLLVVKCGIPDSVKREFMERVVRLNEDAPANGLELSIVKREVCAPFVYPTPFELHFSPAHLKWFREDTDGYVQRMNGTDKDLAAHVMITQTYGRVLFGDEIKDTFGEVSRQNYIDSIWFDIENACEDILNAPMYMILNLCRVLAYVREGLILSKKTGGEWGMHSLPREYRALVEAALKCYETDEEMMVHPDEARRFAEQMLKEIIQQECFMARKITS